MPIGCFIAKSVCKMWNIIAKSKSGCLHASIVTDDKCPSNITKSFRYLNIFIIHCRNLALSIALQFQAQNGIPTSVRTFVDSTLKTTNMVSHCCLCHLFVCCCITGMLYSLITYHASLYQYLLYTFQHAFVLFQLRLASWSIWYIDVVCLALTIKHDLKLRISSNLFLTFRNNIFLFSSFQLYCQLFSLIVSLDKWLSFLVRVNCWIKSKSIVCL